MGSHVKKARPLWRITVTVPAEAQDAVGEALSTLFSEPNASYTDFETGLATVSVFLGSCPAPSGDWRDKIERGLANISRSGLSTSGAAVRLAKVPAEDWAESWKRHFKPIEIGKSLLVVPSWSKRRARTGQALVTLDPGLSFGTGQHPTTSFCLQQLVRARRRGARSFLDIGTGSGILAIAAVKLGYCPVNAFDHDPESIRVARENARKNRIEPRLRIWRQDVQLLSQTPRQQYDLVCANLISNLLIAHRLRICRQVATNGLLALAGILKTEFGQVHAAYERDDFKLLATETQNEWQSGVFVRHR